MPDPTSTPENVLAATDYFSLANQYLDIYQTLSEKIQDPATPPDQKLALYEQSEPLIQKAYEFQRLGFKALTAELNIPVKELQEAVKEAAKTIKLIFQIEKVIEVASDLVAIAAIVSVPAIKPAGLTALPPLVKELRKDVKDLKQSI